MSCSASLSLVVPAKDVPSEVKTALLLTPSSRPPCKDELFAQNDRYAGSDTSRWYGKKSKSAWKKLLWVKQSYPDNYTDNETFLDHLQRNPRLRPYDFWPLISDFTVITQHVCSVVIFLCCFVGIFQETLSPVAVVSTSTICTILGWILWDFWMSQHHVDTEKSVDRTTAGFTMEEPKSSSAHLGYRNSAGYENGRTSTAKSGRHLSTYFTGGSTPGARWDTTITPSLPLLSPRNHQRVATVKSSFLIFCAIMGLSPILKSLTESTTSDSIWAVSCWLLTINIFCFDYGSGERSASAKLPASLSTNAALMAATVLASRLPSTTHVFSLALFSIEVFGLFPAFRRHLRVVSWPVHVCLTIVLIVVAGAFLGVLVSVMHLTLASVLIGILAFSFGSALSMGICSWLLINLQKYKNVVIGPWDPARPVLRRRWDY